MLFRSARATSNICTNQGLLVTAATIYMALLGPTGLRSVAEACHRGLASLLEAAALLPGVSARFQGPHFHEAVIELPLSADEVVTAMAEHGVAGGLALGRYDPALDRCLLVNVTEVHTAQDIARWADVLRRVLRSVGAPTNLLVVEEADRNFKVPKRSSRSREDVWTEILTAMDGWIQKVLES